MFSSCFHWAKTLENPKQELENSGHFYISAQNSKYACLINISTGRTCVRLIFHNIHSWLSCWIVIFPLPVKQNTTFNTTVLTVCTPHYIAEVKCTIYVINVVFKFLLHVLSVISLEVLILTSTFSQVGETQSGGRYQKGEMGRWKLKRERGSEDLGSEKKLTDDQRRLLVL